MDWSSHDLAFLCRTLFEPSRQIHLLHRHRGLARSTDAGKVLIWWDPKVVVAMAGTTVTSWRLIPETPGKIWGAFSNVHDIPNGQYHFPERPGHQYPGRNLPLNQLWRSVDQCDSRTPAQAGDFDRS